MTEENKAGREGEAYWLDDPANFDRMMYALYALCAVFLLLDLLMEHDRLFGFYAWFGLIASIGFVLAAKVLRLLLMRPEDYYD
jgi:hypothetical protein